MPEELPNPPAPPLPPETPTAEENGDHYEALDIATELRDSYLNYAMSVIVSRALPDVRDGLKPSQRRILVAMHDLNLGPAAATSKCAGIVGETMKRYHPHGDASIYPTLVRMAQDWNMRHRLVHGQGNFGSIAGLPPAAMRYCVTGETRVRTTAGTPRIAVLGRAAPDSEADVNLEVLDHGGRVVRASKLFHSGTHPTLRLRTAEGFQLIGTANHPVLCLESVAGVPMLLWRTLGEVTPACWVALFRRPPAGPMPELPAERRSLALLAGAMVSEGWASRKRAGFNNLDKDYFDAVLAAYDAHVGGRRYVYSRRLKSGSLLYELDVHNLEAFAASPLAEMMGLESAEKQVPSFVWAADLAFKRVFLQSLFEGDGSSSLLPRKTISLTYSTRSRALARDVQQLLLEFGVVSRQACYEDGEIKVFISNRRDARLFFQHVGFLGIKNGKLSDDLLPIPQSSRALSKDFVPFLASYVRAEAGGRWGDRDWLNRHNIDRIERWEREGESILGRIASDEVKSVIRPLITGDYFFAPVKSVTAAGERPVYSLRVDTESHSFLTNGFVSHNTEARLSPIAAEMLADLESETVDFIDNYDGKYREPLVLPARFPNLLVNGSDGIAVGMATEIPPHNLREVCDALIKLINEPDASLAELIQLVPGPDFPTGGIIRGRTGIINGYRTGRGKITLRARARINDQGKANQIIIDEVPYQTTRNSLAEKFGELVKDERIKGISSIRDESSARNNEPVRIVIDLKRDADANQVLNQLYQFSPLEKTVSIILLALVDGKPRELTLKEMLEAFLRHRVQVIRRRTEYLMREAKRRAHILEGQLIAISSLDEVIEICRGSPNRAEAKERLKGLPVAATVLERALGLDNFNALTRELGLHAEYHMTDAQAEAVVRLQLGQLAALERDEIIKEYNDLRGKILQYERLLSDEANVRTVIRDDLTHLRDKWGNERKTEIVDEEGDVAFEDLIEDEETAVTISHKGYVKRLPLNTYRSQHRGGRGVSGGGTREDDDFIEHFLVASNKEYLLCFTNRGQVYWKKVYELPAGGRTSPGKHIKNVLQALREDEKISSFITVRFDPERDHDRYLMMATRKGMVKKTALAEYSRPKQGGIIGISLKEGDTLVSVELTSPGDQVVLCTRKGMAIRFDESDARAMGRNTSGVRGIHLRAGDEVVGMVVADPDGYLLTVCENGYGKRTPFGVNEVALESADEGEEAPEAEEPAGEDGAADKSTRRYRRQRRGGYGVRDIQTGERNGEVVDVAAVREEHDILLITTGGMVNRTHVREIPIRGRNTMGVRVMDLKDGDRVASLAKVVSPTEVDEAPAEGEA